MSGGDLDAGQTHYVGDNCPGGHREKHGLIKYGPMKGEPADGVQLSDAMLREETQLPTPSPSDSPGAETNTLPTTKAERDKRREFLNSPTLQHNPLPHVEWELRLIADVEQLKAEAAEHHLNLEDVCLQVNARNADVERLEAERDRLRDILRLGLHHGGAMHECPPECHDWEVAARAAVERPHG